MSRRSVLSQLNTFVNGKNGDEFSSVGGDLLWKLSEDTFIPSPAHFCRIKEPRGLKPLDFELLQWEYWRWKISERPTLWSRSERQYLAEPCFRASKAPARLLKAYQELSLYKQENDAFVTGITVESGPQLVYFAKYIFMRPSL